MKNVVLFSALTAACLFSCGASQNCPTAPLPAPAAASDLAEQITAPNSISVTSADFTDGGTLPDRHVFSGFGCTGGNESPSLSWTGAPEGTQSYAIVVHDPDAPTGVGFFHWLAYDVPATTTTLPRSATNALPEGALLGHTDFGNEAYGGPCPPPGLAHRYVFTVYALDVPTLGIPAGASGALLRFMLKQHTVGYGRITGTYGR